jgi:long-chain fatty acid transport protein
MSTFARTLAAMAVSAALVAPAAHATNGYFKIGYGTKNRGMAGAGIAFSQDSLAPATNPSGIALVGNRMEGGVELFNPNRYGRLDATMMGGADTGKVDSGATLFAIPHAGFSFDMRDFAVGLSMTANGGMNTRYNSNLFTDGFAPAIPGFAGMLAGMNPGLAADINNNAMALGMNPNNNPSLGVNLSQLIIAPTVAKKLNDDHSVGASLLIGYQRFRAYGLGLFQGLSSSPGNATNQGDDDAWGAGVRLGWTGQITDNITLGAQYSSKIFMQEFDKYAGLFAEQGDFDVPANFGVGVAIKVTPKTTVAFDVQRIQYSDVASIANDGPTADEFFGALSSALMMGSYTGPGQLGTDAGWGFGWDDITVYKLGINHQYNDRWTFRGGLNYGENPIDNDQNLFNILAPGVVEKHITLGFTYMPNPMNEVSVTYMRALTTKQSYTYQGTGGFAPFSYDAEIGMDQNALEVSYAFKF